MIELVKLLVKLLTLVRAPDATLLSAPDARDPTLVTVVDNKLDNGVLAIDAIDGTLNDIPVAALNCDTVCRPLCVYT